VIVISSLLRAKALRYWMMFALLVGATPVLAEAPRVVVSIKPLHALVSEVMSGVGEPMLLFSNSASPHDTRLRPSRVRALSRAQLVVWVGPALERSLASTLTNINSANRYALAALDLPELKKLGAKSGGVWIKDDHDHDHEHGTGNVDPHVWLSTENAMVIIKAVATQLGKIDPDNRETYNNNVTKLVGRLSDLAIEIGAMLKPYHKTPYVALHDAFRYFEDQFELSPIGALSPTAGTSPGARRIHELRAHLADHKVHCIAADPFTASPYLKALGDGTGSSTAAMDPMGNNIPTGPGHYEKMMRYNASALAGCLRPH
jgi:zinc transport system substrate-binding protein